MGMRSLRTVFWGLSIGSTGIYLVHRVYPQEPTKKLYFGVDPWECNTLNPPLSGAEAPAWFILKSRAGFPLLPVSLCHLSQSPSCCFPSPQTSRFFPGSPGGSVGRQWSIPAILSWRVTLSRSQTRSYSPGRS